jgi:hypothetical protein
MKKRLLYTTVVVILTGGAITGVVSVRRGTHRRVTVTASNSGDEGASKPWHHIFGMGAVPAKSFSWVATDTGFLTSSDAGSTWIERSLPPAAQSVSATFADPLDGLAVTPGDTPQSVKVFATRDGAASWSLLTSVSDPAPISAASISGRDGELWLLLTRASSSNFSVGDVFLSDNNGGSWTKASDGNPAGVVIALGNQSAIIVGGTGSQHIYATNDGGKTWPESSAEIPGVSSSGPFQFGPPSTTQDGALVPGLSGTQAFVLNVSARSMQISLTVSSSSMPVPIDATHTIVDRQLETSGGAQVANGSVPNLVAIAIGTNAAIGERISSGCVNKQNCNPSDELVESNDLSTWSTLSRAAPEPASTVPPTTVATVTGSIQTLDTGSYKARGWELTAVPTNSGFCYGIGYGSPQPKSCVAVPAPEPALLAIVNLDPPLALGVTRSDVTSVIVRFLSGKRMAAQLSPAPAGFPEGKWYVVAIPDGENVIGQDAFAADGTRLN